MKQNGIWNKKEIEQKNFTFFLQSKVDLHVDKLKVEWHARKGKKNIRSLSELEGSNKMQPTN